jgi:hypothetical protein
MWRTSELAMMPLSHVSFVELSNDLFAVKLMIFFHLIDVDKMLDGTHDPVQGLKNWILNV